MKAASTGLHFQGVNTTNSNEGCTQCMRHALHATHLHALSHVLGPVCLLALVATVAGVPTAKVEGFFPAHHTLEAKQNTFYKR